MDNTIVIDLVLAAVLVVFALRGARKGLIRSLMELVSVVLALRVAGAASDQYARRCGIFACRGSAAPVPYHIPCAALRRDVVHGP